MENGKQWMKCEKMEGALKETKMEKGRVEMMDEMYKKVKVRKRMEI
jgi:hypothetical protein